MSKNKGVGKGNGVGSRKTQFSKGRPGKSPGRPKGSKNLKTLAHKALSKDVTFPKNGESVKMGFIEAVIDVGLMHSAKGSHQHYKILMDFIKFLIEIGRYDDAIARIDEKDEHWKNLVRIYKLHHSDLMEQADDLPPVKSELKKQRNGPIILPLTKENDT